MSDVHIYYDCNNSLLHKEVAFAVFGRSYLITLGTYPY